MSEANFNEFAKQINEVNTLLAHLPGDVVQPGAKHGFQKFGRKFVGTLQNEMRGSRDNTDILHRRTGNLARSLHSDVDESEGKISSIVWIDKSTPYWRSHEFGATITPKKAKFLAIPSELIQTAAGVSRYQSPREIPDLHYAQLQGKNGKTYPVLGKPINGEFKVFFWLVTQVKIPARMHLRDKWKAAAPLAIPMVVEGIRKELDKKIKSCIKRIM